MFVKNRKEIMVFTFTLIFSFIFYYVLSYIFCDEIWCFGFSSNISKGMVIYRDFNVVQGPLYFFIVSLFIRCLGNYIIVMRLFDTLLFATIILMMFKLIGWKSFLMIPLFLVNLASSGYNLLCLFFLVLIIYVLNLDKKYNYLIAFIVGLCLITKQNIGVCLLIPTLFYSKNKVKTIIMFLMPLMLVSIYMLLNNGFYQFIDCCFLGLFDFGTNNGYDESVFLKVFFIVCIVVLIKALLRCKLKNEEVFYVLMFQIMCYPILDIRHFLCAFFPVMYLGLKRIKSKYICFYLGCFVWFLFISLFFITDINIDMNDNSFLYLRNVNNIDFNVIDDDCDLILKYKDYSDYYFLIIGNAYLYKLYLNEDITQYDLILNGNMGYKGEFRLIDSMDSICRSNKCVFFVEKYAFDGVYSQSNRDIFNYVINTYDKIDGNDGIGVYGNIE